MERLGPPQITGDGRPVALTQERASPEPPSDIKPVWALVTSVQKHKSNGKVSFSLNGPSSLHQVLKERYCKRLPRAANTNGLERERHRGVWGPAAGGVGTFPLNSHLGFFKCYLPRNHNKVLIAKTKV